MGEPEQAQSRLAPDDAFSALGNEIRVEILRELGEAGEALAFSELYDRVAVDDSAQFNYHLDRLEGHFVGKSDTGYALRRPGRRVVEAILSGAVTDAPTLERTTTDESCPDCDSRIEIEWREGSVEIYCPACTRRWQQSWGRADGPAEAPPGYQGRLPVPPAGIADRSPTEIYRTAFAWTSLELMSIASDICPRCAATVETELSVCETHDATDGPCSSCGTTYAVRLVAACRNCIYSAGCAAAWGVVSTTELLTFLFEHDLNPIAPGAARQLDAVINGYEEQVRGTDPFRAKFSFSIDGDRLTLTVDETLTVVDTGR